jgi:hypothetical protein
MGLRAFRDGVKYSREQTLEDMGAPGSGRNE